MKKIIPIFVFLFLLLQIVTPCFVKADIENSLLFSLGCAGSYGRIVDGGTYDINHFNDCSFSFQSDSYNNRWWSIQLWKWYIDHWAIVRYVNNEGSGVWDSYYNDTHSCTDCAINFNGITPALQPVAGDKLMLTIHDGQAWYDGKATSGNWDDWFGLGVNKPNEGYYAKIYFTAESGEDLIVQTPQGKQNSRNVAFTGHYSVPTSTSYNGLQFEITNSATLATTSLNWGLLNSSGYYNIPMTMSSSGGYTYRARFFGQYGGLPGYPTILDYSSWYYNNGDQWRFNIPVGTSTPAENINPFSRTPDDYYANNIPSIFGTTTPSIIYTGITNLASTIFAPIEDILTKFSAFFGDTFATTYGEIGANSIQNIWKYGQGINQIFNGFPLFEMLLLFFIVNAGVLIFKGVWYLLKIIR